MANIVLGRAVVPELLQDRAWSGNMVREARALLDSPERLRGMISAFETMKKNMGETKASENVSTLIKEMAHG
jgi:lipid A disaccharide synthetase